MDAPRADNDNTPEGDGGDEFARRKRPRPKTLELKPGVNATGAGAKDGAEQASPKPRPR
jgi:hypothetical protein